MKTSRLENESAKAHAAFLRYAEMGPEKRSIREVARQLRKSSTMIGRWSRRHKWTKQCEAGNVKLVRGPWIFFA